MTAKVILSVEALINCFPHKVNKIHGLPTFDTLQALQKNLQSNAALVACNLGGGTHDYLGLLMDANAYAAEAGNNAQGNPQPFILPVFQAKHLPSTVPTPKYGQDNYEYSTTRHTRGACVKTYIWHYARNLSKQSKTYLSPLRNQVTGYCIVTVFTEYGDINKNKVHANKACFNQPWDGADPFENIIKCIDECVEYARLAQTPYTAVQILSRAKRLVKETGLYHDDMDKWDELPVATNSKNWGTFKPFILLAQRKHRAQTGTAKQVDYGLAIQKMMEAVDGVTNSVSAKQAKQEVARVKQDAKDAKQEAALAAVTAKLEALQRQYTEVLARLSLPANNFTNMPPPMPPVIVPAAAAPVRTKRVPKDEGRYCHSHGYLVIKHHTSANCKWQKEGHQVTATHTNPMGGSKAGKLVA
jgi:hypothetical protein